MTVGSLAWTTHLQSVATTGGCGHENGGVEHHPVPVSEK